MVSLVRPLCVFLFLPACLPAILAFALAGRTGTGGRLRDVMATGRGAKPIAGISSYCVGNLRIPGYPLPWEQDWPYASNLATPLEIEAREDGFCLFFGRYL